MVTLTMAAGSGTAGSTVTLDLSIASTGGDQCTGVEWVFAPNNSLVTVASVALGAAAIAANKTISRAGPLCIVQSIGLNNDVIGDGVLVSATFSIASSATGLITLNLTGIYATDANADPLSTDGIFGSITIPGVTQKGNKGRTRIHKTYSAVVSATMTF